MNNLLKKDKITFQFLLNDSIGGLWYWDHHHPETAFKRSILYSILGYNEHEISLESDKWDHIINQEDLNTALNKFNNLIKAPTHTFDQTLRYRHKNGSIVLLKFLGIIQFNNNGALNRIVGIIQQVSKNQNIAFKNTQKDTDHLKYKSYIENSPDGVFITNEKGQYIEVNKAACDISGYTEKELLQLTIPDLLQEGYLDNAKEHFDKVVNEGFAKGEFGYLKKTGEERFWIIDAVKLSENRFMGFVKDITLQKQAIDNNIQNINFTNTVLESLSHPFYVIDANNYKIKLANPASGLQKNPEKISCYELTHNSKIPCSNTNHPCPLQEVKETGKPAKVEHTHFDKDGNLKNVEVHAYPIFNDQGEITQMIEYVLDITKRKKAEEKLLININRWKEAQQVAQIGNWEFNIQSNQIWGSEEAFRIYGIPLDKKTNPEQILELEEVEACIPERERVNKALLDLIMEEKPYELEYEIISKVSGISQIIYSKASLTKNLEGTPTKVTGTIQDITKRKEAEKEIKDQAEFIDKLIENSALSTWIADKNGTAIRANPACLAFFGATKEEVIGKYNLFNDDVLIQKGFIPKMKKAFQHGEVIDITLDYSLEDAKNISVANATHKIIRSVITPLLDTNNKLANVICQSIDLTDSKKAEQKLKESYEQKQEILDNTKIHIWAFNGEVYTYMNKEWFDYTGQNANNRYTIDSWIKAVHPDDLDAATKIWLKNWESKTEHDNYFRLRNAKGQYKHFFCHAVPIFDSNGNFKYFHGYNIDINELKQKEFELIKLTAAIQQSPSVITITDLEGRLQYINPKFTELTGYQKQEALGEKPSLLKSGCQTDDYYKNLWETISSGKTWHGEFHNKKKNGDLFWEKATISPIFNQSNEITNYVKLAEDITEQKRIEETQKILLEISKTTNQYDSLFHFIETIHEKIKTVLRADNFYVAFYHQDDNTYSFPYHVDEIDTIELNKPFDFSNGLTDYVFKSNRSMIIRPDDHKNITEYAIKGYGDNQSVWLGVPLKPSDKSKPIGVIAIQDYKNLESYTERDKAVFEIIAYHIFGFIQRIKYMEDIIAAKEKAEKNEKLKSAFLANMSHEIRTPMNGVLGFLELLQEPDISEYERQDFLNRIKKSGNRLLNTINDIIEFSNIDTNEIKNINQELYLNDVLEELIEFFQLEASNKSIDLKLQIDPQLKNSLIKSDRNKIISIFTNLIKNALKFTSSGCICVGCDLKTDYIKCFVKDSGKGIPKHKQKIIFERFRQANDYQTGDNEGSGLGLAITKAYVEMMGGEIKLVSEPGKGSEFIFTFDYIAAH